MTDIHTALDDLLNHQDVPLDTVLDRHFSPPYRQRTNGGWEDRHGLRGRCARWSPPPKSRLWTARADRHIVRVAKRDGATVVQEVYLFAELDVAGRFARVEETTLMLNGAEADRALGSVK
ncbi:hypothetical protein [Paenirhodobacter sp.]|uniref:hypothetical protein n=1 Tax=Paenirhodobacter sp. TaxID=1965326 RepID=UPI003B3C062E